MVSLAQEYTLLIFIAAPPMRKTHLLSSSLDITTGSLRKVWQLAQSYPGPPDSGHNRPSMPGLGVWGPWGREAGGGWEVRLEGEPEQCHQEGSCILLPLTRIIRSTMEPSGKCVHVTSNEETM